MAGRVVSVDHHYCSQLGRKGACSHLADEATAIQGGHLTCLREQGWWLNSRLQPFLTWWQMAKCGIQKSACVPREHFSARPLLSGGSHLNLSPLKASSALGWTLDAPFLVCYMGSL